MDNKGYEEEKDVIAIDLIYYMYFYLILECFIVRLIAIYENKHLK